MQLKRSGSVLEDLLTALGKKIKPKVFPPNKGDADCAEEQHRHLGLVSGQKYSLGFVNIQTSWGTGRGSKGSSYQGFISAMQTFRDNREKATELRAWVTLQPRSVPTDLRVPPLKHWVLPRRKQLSHCKGAKKEKQR